MAGSSWIAVLSFLVHVTAGYRYILNAGVLGYSGSTNIGYYEAVANAIASTTNDHCFINFTAVEYDTRNGSTVYDSLEAARSIFSDPYMTVAIGPHIDVFASTNYVIRNQLHLVTSSEGMEPTNQTIPILPDPRSLSTAIAKVIKELKWSKVAFLSQDDFSPVLTLSSENIFVWPIRLPARIVSPDDPELIQTLTLLRESEMQNLILHSMKRDVVKIVIECAKRLHLLHHSLRWFITYLDFEDVTDGLDKMALIYGFQLLKKDQIPEELTAQFNSTFSRLDLGLMVDVIGILRFYLSDTGCEEEPFMDEYLSAETFRDRLRTSKTLGHIGALQDYFWSISRGGTGYSRSKYSIEVNKYNGVRTQVGVVSFNPGIPPRASINGFIAQRHLDDVFMGTEFTVITHQDEPFVMMRDGKYVGFCVDVLNELARTLNFKYEIFELDYETSGPKNVVWDDIINQLVVGNASIAIGALSVSAEREEKISFSYTILSTTVSLLITRPPDTRNYFLFLGPFSTWLWLMIVLFFVVVGVCLYLMSKYDHSQRGKEQQFDLKESMWYSINVLLQGSTEYSPPTTSTRTIIAFFWFCTLIINAAYTANLAAYLTLQQIDNRIKSVDELARQSLIKYGIFEKSELLSFFAESREDPYERMWTFMKLHESESILKTRKEGVDKAIEGSFAYLDFGVVNTYFANQHCSVEAIEQDFGYKHFGMGFPKGAPYRDDINQALLRLKEKGTLDELKNKWWTELTNCTARELRRTSNEKATAELELDNMFGVFIVLVAMTILAICFEIGKQIYICKKKYESKKEKKVKEENNVNNPTEQKESKVSLQNQDSQNEASPADV